MNKSWSVNTHTVAIDPRAPRLAAASTLLAGGLLVASAVNLQLDLVGVAGISTEEMGAVVFAAISIIIAKFANQERPVPELVQSPTGYASTMEASSFSASSTSEQPSVNPTTASILTSILGDTSASDAAEVESAISTLSTGEFGAAVVRTMEEVESANMEISNNREASPTDEQTGQTLERVLVEPVPLPGRENEASVDPSAIPGLNPNREFVRDGTPSVPLPDLAPVAHQSSTHTVEAPTPAPTLPDLPDLPELPQREAALSNEHEIGSPSQNHVTTPTLPDLDDLFATDDSATPPQQPSSSKLPDLPNLDDLF